MLALAWLGNRPNFGLGDNGGRYAATSHRSRTEKVFFGVCGGLGDYFGIDPTVVRIAFVWWRLPTGLGF